jgi:hypothetical protein
VAAVILSDEWQVVDRLAELALSRDGLLEVVHRCTAGYAGCTDNDPPAARGWEAWRMGVRGLREIFCGKEWTKSDAGGFSTIVNHQLQLQIAIASTDEVTGLIRGDLAPENRLPKGSTAERAVAVNQVMDQLPLALVGGGRPGDVHVNDYQTWHFCVYIRGDIVRAELSRYNGYSGGFLTNCRERIFIVAEGEWTTPDLGRGDDSGPEFDFDIRRKQ